MTDLVECPRCLNRDRTPLPSRPVRVMCVLCRQSGRVTGELRTAYLLLEDGKPNLVTFDDVHMLQRMFNS